MDAEVRQNRVGQGVVGAGLQAAEKQEVLQPKLGGMNQVLGRVKSLL